MSRSVLFTGIPGLVNALGKQYAMGTVLLRQYFTVKSYPSTFSSILDTLGDATSSSTLSTIVVGIVMYRHLVFSYILVESF